MDLLKPSRAQVCEYLTILADHGIEPGIEATTRDVGDILAISSIDHINLRVPSATTKTAVISQKVSDHYFVACHLVFPGDRPLRDRNKERRVEIVDRHRFDKCISAYDWHSFQRSTTPSNLPLCSAVQAVL